jgi:GrpB-like predicted nucleotidyltransferase (UPF0157 family)
MLERSEVKKTVASLYRGLCIDMLTRMTEPVIVVDYDPKWQEVFAVLRERIGNTLGDLAAAIEHVGSTAVPGLAAKPVVDIDVLLSSAGRLQEAIKRLARLGYVHEGNLGIEGREAFRQPTDEPAHHLYVCAPDTTEFLRHIAFRDYLRFHPESARIYGELKRCLAMEYPSDRARYGSGKDEFVREVLRRASPSRTG